MIHSLEFRDVATFLGSHSVTGLKSINYFFGSNGSGKSTIAKVIAAANPAHCTLTWTKDIPLDRIVYNEEWIRANFAQTEELKGIFTLGEEEINLGNQIQEARERCDDLQDGIAKETKSRDGDSDDPDFQGLEQKLQALESELKEECWTVKQKNEAKYKDALKGCLLKLPFKNRALLEASNNKCKSVDVGTLQSRVQVVFGPGQEKLTEIPLPSFVKLLEHETSSILAKIVVGKEDVDIAALIQELGNSDWVRQGVKFLGKSPEVCPFCQNGLPDTLKESLNAYFDKAFIADTDAINGLLADYSIGIDAIKQQLHSIEQSKHKYLDLDAFQQAAKVLDLQLKANLELIRKKQEESSRAITLGTIKDSVDKVLALINAANVEVKKHNKLIDERELEKVNLEAEVWKLMLDDGLTLAVKDYNAKKEGLEKGKKILTGKIKQLEAELKTARNELANLEKKMVSVEPTVNEINKLLEMFGFKGFKLAMTGDKNSYVLVRANGEPAKHTLSEGEKTFVTFLYFYHMIKGSSDGATISSARIVVFDDPVSSLDSDVLHIVSSLIRELFASICSGNGTIKQVFILTHNISFHKEVSYLRKRNKGISPSHITYWKVHKQNEQSSIRPSEKNPVRSHYEMLWAEIRIRNANTICNTLRRILEQAARLLGGIKLANLEKQFSGDSLTACRTLLGWVHDGSHFSYDDECITVDESTIDIYLTVFRNVFVHSGWEAHYDHMMTIDQADEEEQEQDLEVDKQPPAKRKGRKSKV